MEQHLPTIVDDLPAKLHEVLLEKFHFNAFRPGQLEAITTLMQQGRLLCIQPTGHGKSLLYQLPATILDGITIVISPLLALMRDQVSQLNERFNISAASINSDQEDKENYRAQQLAARGEIKILFVAPEKLDHVDYFDFLLNLPVSFVVVDEAHCISTWGHDFRPSYRQIINFIHAVEQKNSAVKVLAITATANQKTEEDIKKQLTKFNQLISMQRQNMDRANIQLSVIAVSGPAEKLHAVEQLLEKLPGHGLIYCATRENTELVAEYLQYKGVNAAAYHAGFDPDKKRQLQHNFVNNQYKVISATNALGMGIDKQDLRFIIHFDVPGSITAYYQEVGRCGRDGQLAQGILLFDAADKKIQDYFIGSAQPAVGDFELVMQSVKQAIEAPSLTDIKTLTGLHPTRITTVIAELVEQGFLIKKSPNKKQLYYSAGKQEKPDLSRYQNQFQVRIFELNEMINYGAQSTVCLMKLLRKALGDIDVTSCGHCGICASPSFAVQKIKKSITQIKDWLNLRAPTISTSAKNRLSEGVAVLNSQLRSPAFIDFMTMRSTMVELDNEELLALIKQHLNKLKKQYAFTAVLAMPSRTWLARNNVAQFIAEFLRITLLTDYLQWHTMPNARQGELLNNDQRRRNVDQHMHGVGRINISPGAILLLDDYVGSGATIQEAARVLRKDAKLNNPIVPFTIAAVKWRLGKRGMI